MNLFPILDRLRDLIRRHTHIPERASGLQGEDLAMRFLQRHKYVIVARNYRPRAGYGEIDLVGWENGVLAFIEVKTRASQSTASPEHDVDPDKRNFLVRTAREYAVRAKVDFTKVRFDIVTVLATPPRELQLFRAAFTPH